MWILSAMNTKKKGAFQSKLELIIDMYHTHTYDEIGKKIGVSRQRVYQMVQQMKDNGVDLPAKRSPAFDWETFVKKQGEK